MPARKTIRAGLVGVGLMLGWPAASRGGEGTLTVATWNVQNYNSADRMVEETYRSDYPKPEIEKAAVRAVLVALDADVVALQEIGSEAHVWELQRDLRSDGLDYAFTVFMEAEDGLRGLAVLSRRAFSGVERHDELDFAYLGERARVRRGMLEVRLRLEERELSLFVVHLKSRYTEREDDPAAALLRGAEATAARNRVLERFPVPGAADAWFAILGDFNDGPRSRAVRAFEQRGELALASLLPAADSRGEAWTHHFRREDTYTRVDHVMVSAALAQVIAGTGATIYDGSDFAAASDHRPVRVTLRLDDVAAGP